MNGNYEDILFLPHYVSQTRNKMSAADRAAQFSPFSALTGFDAAIQECGRLTDVAVELEEDEKIYLNTQLSLLYKYQGLNPQIIVNFFVPDSRKDGGDFVTITGNIQKIDAHFKRIILSDGIVIAFDRIRWIQNSLEDQKQCLDEE